MPIAEAIRINTTLPTMPLDTPPPVSPGDRGSLVKKLRSKHRQPFTTRLPRIRNRTETVSTVQMPVTVSMTLFTRLRRAILFMKPSGPLRLSRSLPRGGDNQQLGGRVQNHGEREQHQSEFHQSAEINVAGGFREFIRDDGRDGVTGR